MIGLAMRIDWDGSDQSWRSVAGLYDTFPNVIRQLPDTRGGRATRRGLRPLVRAAWLGLLAGCASAPRAGDLERAVGDYRAARYEQAQQQAAEIEQATSGVLRDQATYLAGLCAYRMDDHDEARRRLAGVARSEDPVTAGNARAVLGLLLLEQQRYPEAAARLAEAYSALAGEDARHAAYHAARAYRAAGDEASAARWLEIARGGRRRLAVPERAGAFTLQVGAFRQRRYAERAASDAAGVAERHGLTPVQIVPEGDERGRTLYLVQFGRFDSRAAAAAARSRLGELQFIVAAVQRSHQPSAISHQQ
ncbi:MAG: tetratricopeptide repeat protein [Planctomycetota bacterium]|jgi:hypothetical protein